MGLILNATAESVTFQVFGSHFTLAPGKTKMFTPTFSDFIADKHRDLGLVSLPEAFEDYEFMQTPEAKLLIEEKKREGVANRIRKLKEIIYNNQVSLRQDLEIKNLKVAPEAMASSGEIKAMKELARYADLADQEETAKVEEVQKLLEKAKRLE